MLHVKSRDSLLAGLLRQFQDTLQGLWSDMLYNVPRRIFCAFASGSNWDKAL